MSVPPSRMSMRSGMSGSSRRRKVIACASGPDAVVTINRMTEPREKIVGRLAPSPTGAQHVGNARTYLIAWLSARSQGGRVVLRIEDIDSSRVKPGAIEETCDDLRWLGLDWDGDVIVQTQRLPLYRAAFERLKSMELVYPCTCTRADIERS